MKRKYYLAKLLLIGMLSYVVMEYFLRNKGRGK